MKGRIVRPNFCKTLAIGMMVFCTGSTVAWILVGAKREAEDRVESTKWAIAETNKILDAHSQAQQLHPEYEEAKAYLLNYEHRALELLESVLIDTPPRGPEPTEAQRAILLSQDRFPAGIDHGHITYRQDDRLKRLHAEMMLDFGIITQEFTSYPVDGEELLSPELFLYSPILVEEDLNPMPSEDLTRFALTDRVMEFYNTLDVIVSTALWRN